MNFIETEKRTHYCGALRADHAECEVVLMGWVASRRDLGGLVFIDVRDREGLVQVVLDPSQPKMQASSQLRGEFVVALKGRVKRRPADQINRKMSTGEVEVVAEHLEVLSAAEVPPFQVADEKVGEDLRLKYRYLDLRSPRLQSHLRVRHQVAQCVRRVLDEEKFLEIETPILYKSTPEGARDYLVPSRIHPGEFYALPQSPQTLKQLLMVAGYDRYFQIARCFRDEDLRADRQPEFSQIDIEMSFVAQDDVLRVNEKLLRTIWKETVGVEIGEIPHMTYAQAMNRFGCDKPDLRFGLELKDLGDVLKDSGFKVFDEVAASGGALKGLAAPGQAQLSRKQIDQLTAVAKKAGAKGLVWIKWAEDKVSSSVAKFFSEEQLKNLVQACGGGPGDAAFIVAAPFDTCCAALSALRLHFGRELNLIPDGVYKLAWIVDFPLFERDPGGDQEDGRWFAKHHPFTAPRPDQVEILLQRQTERYGELLANAYDLVCNGHELGGGSLRIHDQRVQQAMFEALGMSEAEIHSQFGFFIEALSYGTPPHGGIAWGMDRLVMVLCGTEAIREVIAFPKTTKAADLMAAAPSSISAAQLAELGLVAASLSE